MAPKFMEKLRNTLQELYRSSSLESTEQIQFEEVLNSDEDELWWALSGIFDKDLPFKEVEAKITSLLCAWQQIQKEKDLYDRDPSLCRKSSDIIATLLLLHIFPARVSFGLTRFEGTNISTLVRESSDEEHSSGVRNSEETGRSLKRKRSDEPVPSKRTKSLGGTYITRERKSSVILDSVESSEEGFSTPGNSGNEMIKEAKQSLKRKWSDDFVRTKRAKAPRIKERNSPSSIDNSERKVDSSSSDIEDVSDTEEVEKNSRSLKRKRSDDAIGTKRAKKEKKIDKPKKWVKGKNEWVREDQKIDESGRSGDEKNKAKTTKRRQVKS